MAIDNDLAYGTEGAEAEDSAIEESGVEMAAEMAEDDAGAVNEAAEEATIDAEPGTGAAEEEAGSEEPSSDAEDESDAEEENSDESSDDKDADSDKKGPNLFSKLGALLCELGASIVGRDSDIGKKLLGYANNLKNGRGLNGGNMHTDDQLDLQSGNYGAEVEEYTKNAWEIGVTDVINGGAYAAGKDAESLAQAETSGESDLAVLTDKENGPMAAYSRLAGTEGPSEEANAAFGEDAMMYAMGSSAQYEGMVDQIGYQYGYEGGEADKGRALSGASAYHRGQARAISNFIMDGYDHGYTLSDEDLETLRTDCPDVYNMLDPRVIDGTYVPKALGAEASSPEEAVEETTEETETEVSETEPEATEEAEAEATEDEPEVSETEPEATEEAEAEADVTESEAEATEIPLDASGTADSSAEAVDEALEESASATAAAAGSAVESVKADHAWDIEKQELPTSVNAAGTPGAVSTISHMSKDDKELFRQIGAEWYNGGVYEKLSQMSAEERTTTVNGMLGSLSTSAREASAESGDTGYILNVGQALQALQEGAMDACDGEHGSMADVTAVSQDMVFGYYDMAYESLKGAGGPGLDDSGVMFVKESLDFGDAQIVADGEKMTFIDYASMRADFENSDVSDVLKQFYTENDVQSRSFDDAAPAMDDFAAEPEDIAAAISYGGKNLQIEQPDSSAGKSAGDMVADATHTLSRDDKFNMAMERFNTVVEASEQAGKQLPDLEAGR